MLKVKLLNVMRNFKKTVFENKSAVAFRDYNCLRKMKYSMLIESGIKILFLSTKKKIMKRTIDQNLLLCGSLDTFPFQF